MDVVLFDCDGVLIDSEAVVLGVLESRFRDALPAHEGVEDAVASLLGLPIEAIAGRMTERYGVAFDPSWIAEARGHIERSLVAMARSIPDVGWALERIDQPKAVVSNSEVAHVRSALERTGLAGFFGDNVFAAEQVARSKPAPDVYLHAAASLGVEPGRCIAIEDSRAGVTAAVAAGLTVIGFTGGGHIREGHARLQREIGALASIGSMRDLPSILQRLREGLPVQSTELQ